MQINEEFKVQNAAGKPLIMLKISKGISYLDFGMAHLPRDFEGYMVKHTDQVALPQSDGSFKLKDTEEVFKRV
ncbi:hypothetical protein HEAR1201 [Herminiimonas arsenicoxydans]|uniref:Uncharacterized protein n=1 Tax=Herminiimonas arsenicoxydans TaxID=204773 RepID=A4G4E1_HERAR|nr:hypothetical protein HEAR1201 [Herminiimonas arsenicoxydans]